MKQHITRTQLKELSPKGLENIYTWYMNTYHKNNATFPVEAPLLSIGQMIEFLRTIGFKKTRRLWSWYFFEGPHAATKDICDILWEAVKEVLEK